VEKETPLPSDPESQRLRNKASAFCSCDASVSGKRTRSGPRGPTAPAAWRTDATTTTSCPGNSRASSSTLCSDSLSGMTARTVANWALRRTDQQSFSRSTRGLVQDNKYNIINSLHHVSTASSPRPPRETGTATAVFARQITNQASGVRAGRGNNIEGLSPPRKSSETSRKRRRTTTCGNASDRSVENYRAISHSP
jgi:hypothetical protein